MELDPLPALVEHIFREERPVPGPPWEHFLSLFHMAIPLALTLWSWRQSEFQICLDLFPEDSWVSAVGARLTPSLGDLLGPQGITLVQDNLFSKQDLSGLSISVVQTLVPWQSCSSQLQCQQEAGTGVQAQDPLFQGRGGVGCASLGYLVYL